MLNLPHKYISVTQTEMFLRCPRQYWYRYIEGKKRPPAVALVEGSSHHIALDHNNSQKIDSHKDLLAKEVESCFCDTFTDKSKEIENWENQTKDKVIERGRGLLNLYMAETSPKIQPTDTELRFKTVLHANSEPLPLEGIIDLVQDGSISDYKVVGRTKSQADADNSLQLATYGTVVPAKSAEFICLVKTKKPKVERIETKLTLNRGEWAERVIMSVARAISSGSFPLCNPTEWCCSKRFCGYWDSCRGKIGLYPGWLNEI